MSEFQDAKAVVRAYQAAVDAAAPDAIAAVLAAHTTADYLWRGMHPFDIRNGAQEVAEILGGQLSNDEKVWKEIISEVDTDGNGEIDFAEF